MRWRPRPGPARESPCRGLQQDRPAGAQARMARVRSSRARGVAVAAVSRRAAGDRRAPRTARRVCRRGAFGEHARATGRVHGSTPCRRSVARAGGRPPSRPRQADRADRPQDATSTSRSPAEASHATSPASDRGRAARAAWSGDSSGSVRPSSRGAQPWDERYDGKAPDAHSFARAPSRGRHARRTFEPVLSPRRRRPSGTARARTRRGVLVPVACRPH